MKVLITTPRLEKLGGVAIFYEVLQKYFRQDVEYFSVGSLPHRERWGCSIFRLLRDYWRFWRKLRNTDYDIVHLNPSLTPKAITRDAVFLLIAKVLGKKVLVFMLGWDFKCEQIIRRYFLTLFRFVYFKADAFVVPASEFRHKLKDMGYHKRIFLKTTAVDDIFLAYRNIASDGNSSDSEERKFNILFLSRVEKTKGVYEVIDTYRILKARHPKLFLTIAGNGAELDSVIKYARNLGIQDIKFPGFVEIETKTTLFKQADVYFFPSYSEGMPISVLEAMALGLPIVTRPVGGIRDFFENGKMGFITDSLSPDDFAPLLEKLIENPHLQRQIGQFNRRFAKKHFAASVVTGRIEDIYRKLLKPSTFSKQFSVHQS